MIRRALLALGAVGLLGLAANVAWADGPNDVSHAVLKGGPAYAQANVTPVRWWGRPGYGYYQPWGYSYYSYRPWYGYSYPYYSYYPYSYPYYSYYPGYTYPYYSSYPGYYYYYNPGYSVGYGGYW